jgi:hypothetical protein
MSYGGNGAAIGIPPSNEPAMIERTAKKDQSAGCSCGCNKAACNGTTSTEPPDFSRMTPAQKIAYHKSRWDRILG